MRSGGANHPKTLALAHDPAREAAASMRGYSYQILSSVSVWMGLADEQVLFLEGAEDFDVARAEEVTTVQVKDTAGSRNITLRSPGVISAIAHYWEHRSRNPGRRVTFRYLTTSEVGQEDGNPFGHGVRGIELWERLKTNAETASRTEAVGALRKFLISENRLPIQLREFVQRASDEQFIEDFVLAMEWVTNAPGSEKLLNAIKDQLVLHGERKGIPAESAENVVGALYLEAWLAATKEKDRALDRASFIRLFDRSTRMSLPSTTVEALLAQVTGITTQSPISTELSSARIVADPPPLPSRYHHRSILLEALATAARGPVALLYGATGTGKTTAASALCGHDPRPWVWIDLRGDNASAIHAKLSIAETYAANCATPTSIVLDDLDTSTDARPYQGALSRLAAVEHRRGATLVITTAHEPPSRLSQALGLDPRELIRMPPFSREEIAAFLEERGCPSDRCQSLATLVELATQGHSQLVHARVAALESDGFPLPRPEDLSQTPRDILDVQAESRRLLAQLDPAARELIYRLSLVIVLMDRDRLMGIAGAPPPITAPGNALDQLIGPWLEAVQPDVYRISPLVRSAGEIANGPAWARSTHRAIANALLTRQSLTPSDVSEIVMHAVAGHDGHSLARLSIGLRSAEPEVWRAIAETTYWFALVAIEPGQQLPYDTAGVLFLGRLLQYRIAAAGGHAEVAKKIAARVDEEFPQSSLDQATQLSRFIFLTQMVMFREDIAYPMRELIACGTEFMVLADLLDDILPRPNLGDRPDPMVNAAGQRDYAVFVGWTLATSIKTTQDLVQAIDALGEIGVDQAAKILWGFGSNESQSRMLLDRIWLTEQNSDAPDWRNYRDAVRRLYALARRLGLVGLARAAAKVAVIRRAILTP